MPSPDRLDSAIAALQQRIGAAPGVTESQLFERERELGSPFPESVRRLLIAVNIDAWYEFVNSIKLYPPQDCSIIQSQFDLPDDQSEQAGQPPYFCFAAGVFGDAVLGDQTGRIVLADHEAGEGIVLAENLAEWIEKLLEFDGTEYAYVSGEIYQLDAVARRRFLTRHLALNPGSEWAARAMMQLDFPGGHPLGHHHWDRRTHRLVPIAEAEDAKHIHLSNASQREIDSLAFVRDCVHLMIVGGAGLDFSPLLGISTLTDLYLYDIPEVDARQLAKHPSLKDVCFLRCRVNHVDALADISTLKRLRLNECKVDEEEHDRFRARRREMRLE